jgi:hypothetical protein
MSRAIRRKVWPAPGRGNAQKRAPGGPGAQSALGVGMESAGPATDSIATAETLGVSCLLRGQWRRR